MPDTRILPSLPRFRNRRSLERQALATPVTARPNPELAAYYDALFRAHDQQHWWPGRTRFEIIVGAILTQNTSWTNVERAIAQLRREKLLTPLAIEKVSLPRLARLIRSSGYFRQKARTLKEFVRFLRVEYQGSLNKMFAMPTGALREQLLSVHGIGPETADSILLYAGGHKVFVVDAYTRRILERHGLSQPKASYEEIRALFEASLTPDAALFNEYHALIVHTGKYHCQSREPNCQDCALSEFLPKSKASGAVREESTARNGCATMPGARFADNESETKSHEPRVMIHE